MALQIHGHTSFKFGTLLIIRRVCIYGSISVHMVDHNSLRESMSYDAQVFVKTNNVKFRTRVSLH